MTQPAKALDFGYLVEGRVSVDPATGAVTIVDLDSKGAPFDPLGALRAYDGKEVRFTLATFETLEALTKILSV